MSDFELRVFAVSGAERARVSDFEALAYRRVVGAPGVLRFSLAGDHAAIAHLVRNAPVEVWRRWPEMGIGWRREFCGLFRDSDEQYDTRARFEATCPGVMTLLGRRHVLWYAGTANRARFEATPAETVMKTLVAYNATALASTANGRVRDGALAGVGVQADTGGGNVVDWSCAWDNLLTTIQDLAGIAGGDFDLVKTGGAAYEFRWYPGQMGTDRRGELVFGLERGNMARPRLKRTRSAERTAAVVGGKGEGSSRAVRVCLGVDYQVDNDIESFVFANNIDGTAALDSRGAAALEATRAQVDFSFDVLQVDGCRYGAEYDLGDLATARYGNFAGVVQIRAVAVAVKANGGEDVQVETRLVEEL